jgi:chromosome segregation ATPase
MASFLSVEVNTTAANYFAMLNGKALVFDAEQRKARELQEQLEDARRLLDTQRTRLADKKRAISTCKRRHHTLGSLVSAKEKTNAEATGAKDGMAAEMEVLRVRLAAVREQRELQEAILSAKEGERQQLVNKRTDVMGLLKEARGELDRLDVALSLLNPALLIGNFYP